MGRLVSMDCCLNVLSQWTIVGRLVSKGLLRDVLFQGTVVGRLVSRDCYCYGTSCLKGLLLLRASCLKGAVVGRLL